MSQAIEARDVPGPFTRILPPLPYILLGVATVLGLLTKGQSTQERLVTAGIAAAASVWILVMYTLRSPSWRSRTVPMLVYVGGQTALATVLTTRQPIFFVFAVIGFVQAYDLLPPVWAFASIIVTSIVVNVAPSGIPNTVEWAVVVVVVICLQGFMIGWFGFLGTGTTSRPSNVEKPWPSWKSRWPRTPACTPSWWRRRARPASTMSGNGWRGRSMTPSPKG